MFKCRIQPRISKKVEESSASSDCATAALAQFRVHHFFAGYRNVEWSPGGTVFGTQIEYN